MDAVPGLYLQLPKASLAGEDTCNTPEWVGRGKWKGTADMNWWVILCLPSKLDGSAEFADPIAACRCSTLPGYRCMDMIHK